MPRGGRRRTGSHHHWGDWISALEWYFTKYLPLSTVGKLVAGHLTRSKNKTIRALGEALAYQVH